MTTRPLYALTFCLALAACASAPPAATTAIATETFMIPALDGGWC